MFAVIADNIFFFHEGFCVNASSIHFFSKILVSSYYVPAWSRNFLALKELKALNSGYKCCDGRNTGAVEGTGKMSNLEERGQGKLPGGSKSKLRSLR